MDWNAVDWLRREGAVVKSALGSFLVAVLVACSIGWWAIGQFHQERIATLQERVGVLETRLSGKGEASGGSLATRPAIFEFMLETALLNDGKSGARKFTVRLNNRSRDWPLRGTINALNITVDGKSALGVAQHRLPDVDPETYRDLIFALGDFVIPPRADKVGFVFDATYDTIPPQSERRTRHTCELPLVWGDSGRSAPSPTNPVCTREEL